MTLSYFHYPTVTKIDLIKKDTHLDYYTVLKHQDYITTMKIFEDKYCNCTEGEYWQWLWKLVNVTDLGNIETGHYTKLHNIRVDHLLNVLIKLNLTYQFYDVYRFYYNDRTSKYYSVNDQKNLIHYGYIVKDIYHKDLIKFWTYKMNRKIDKKLEVNTFYSNNPIILS